MTTHWPTLVFFNHNSTIYSLFSTSDQWTSHLSTALNAPQHSWMYRPASHSTIIETYILVLLLQVHSVKDLACINLHKSQHHLYLHDNTPLLIINVGIWQESVIIASSELQPPSESSASSFSAFVRAVNVWGGKGGEARRRVNMCQASFFCLVSSFYQGLICAATSCQTQRDISPHLVCSVISPRSSECVG